MNETKTAAEKAEDRAIRRRWITIGEGVAVAGVLIAAGSLYLSWSEKRETTAERQAEKAEEARKATTVTFVGKPDGDDLTLADPAHPGVASIDVSFPRALGVPVQTAVLEPRIEAGWVHKPLLDATDGGPDRVQGRLPVLIAATVSGDNGQSVDRAIYDVVFETEGRTFGGRGLKLKGVLLRQHVAAGDATARLDQLWAIEARRLAGLRKN
ncbi:hypothetical protein LZK98_11185 [Sphingomonas cannabina]|uniref:hypothetical protein n=1 Tax=Sphingomonas cannabina TaxID=2899123 RepID=UPI001F273F73|nr:hypothetical protein [Sphingomonas cannabina]UIJ43654.1 hypothetical protein LZK98_11185 [Sphingomonas cannabina]